MPETPASVGHGCTCPELPVWDPEWDGTTPPANPTCRYHGTEYVLTQDDLLAEAMYPYMESGQA